MGNRRRAFLAALTVAALGGGLWFALSPREPYYQGKPLSVWLEGYDGNNGDDRGSRQADEAIRHLGTNAVPTLLRLLKASDSDLNFKLARLSEILAFSEFTGHDPVLFNRRAARGFKCLGPDGACAVPALVRIYVLRISMSNQGYTANSLGYIGPPARDAVPSLLLGIKDRDNWVRWSAVWALGRIHSQPGSVVPALINAVQDVDPFVRGDAAMALGEFGPDARSCIPILVKVINDRPPPWVDAMPDGQGRTVAEMVRADARQAIRMIDPDAADAAPK